MPGLYLCNRKNELYEKIFGMYNSIGRAQFGLRPIKNRNTEHYE